MTIRQHSKTHATVTSFVPSDQCRGVDDWKRSRCCCWPVMKTVSWPRCGREAGGVGARWSGPAALWPSETRHVWWCRPCGGWSPPSLTAGWTHCAPGRQNDSDWMKYSEIFTTLITSYSADFMLHSSQVSRFFKCMYCNHFPFEHLIDAALP